MQGNVICRDVKISYCSLVLACRYLLVVGWFDMSCCCPQSILGLQTFVQTAEVLLYEAIACRFRSTSLTHLKDVMQYLDCESLGRVRKPNLDVQHAQNHRQCKKRCQSGNQVASAPMLGSSDGQVCGTYLICRLLLLGQLPEDGQARLWLAPLPCQALSEQVQGMLCA